MPHVTIQNEALAGDYQDVSQFVQDRDNTSGSQLTYVRLSDGEHLGSANERLPRPALSLAKLYIADFVLRDGSDDDKDLVREMIVASDDQVATDLMEKYPHAITATATRYGLWSTKQGERWGTSVTSTYDVVKYVRAKLAEDPNSPLLLAMRQSHEVASDGYEQNFGTATLKGVKGTKWGWSDEKELHASVSFGDDFVVAAAVEGSAEDLTALVTRHLAPKLAG